MTIAQKIRCREITGADIDAVADLLARGFYWRSRDYWMRGLRRQAERQVPAGYPRFGYMIDNSGVPAGVLLQIYTARNVGGETAIYCNLSSWYVDPAFRNYAPMMTKIAQKNKEVTYVNISPATWTWPIIETQGFSAYCSGLLFSLPFLSRVPAGMTVETVTPDTKAIAGLSDEDVQMLARHAGYGCLSVVCRNENGEAKPFILMAMRIRKGWIAPPAMQLIYCRDTASFIKCAGAIGRLLLRHRKISVLLDANGPIEGLTGLFTKVRGRKYFRGPHQPRLADLTDTEVVLYGP